jgi:hypothetical protein
VRSLLKKTTSLTAIAAGAAAAMVILGIVAIAGGSYDHQVVREQLAVQKIVFPKPAAYPNLAKYAGQKVLTGEQARAFANDQLGPDLNKIAGGLTYSQFAYSRVNKPWGDGRAGETQAEATLFTGETLKGLLLNAWGWAKLGSIAILAGILLIIFGAILFVLPLLNWWLNLRGSETDGDTHERSAQPSPIPPRAV